MLDLSKYQNKLVHNYMINKRVEARKVSME